MPFSGSGKKKEALSLRKQFPSGGVYSKEATRPLWGIDWYSFEVFVANDGKHLIRKGPWPSNGTDEAVSFFADGRLLKTYAVQDLIKDVSVLPHSTSHFQWSDAFDLDDAAKTLTIATLDRQKIVFNFETGEKLSIENDEPKDHQTNGTCVGLILVAGLTVSAIVAIWQLAD